MHFAFIFEILQSFETEHNFLAYISVSDNLEYFHKVD